MNGMLMQSCFYEGYSNAQAAMAGDPYPSPPPAARFVGIDLGVTCAGDPGEIRCLRVHGDAGSGGGGFWLWWPNVAQFVCRFFWLPTD